MTSPERPGRSDALPGARTLDRRMFMKLLGAGIAAVGAQACVEPPPDRIVPYVDQPPEVTPGVPVSYATAFVLDGFATGVLAQCREGRPIKIEGNPHHPASLGAAGVLAQASLFGLYDPDRGRAVRGPGREVASFQAALDPLRSALEEDHGRGVHLLLEPTSSLLRARLLDRLRERHPGVEIHFHAPVPDGSVRAAAALFGRPLLPLYRFDRARVVVSFGADFTASGPFDLRYARDVAGGRAPRSPSAEMNRLYQAEAHPTATGTVADHPLPVRPGTMPWLLAALVEALEGPGGSTRAALPASPGDILQERARTWVRFAAADLRDHAGRSLVVAGEQLPPEAHALAHRANAILGNTGRTVVRVPSPILEAGESSHGLAPLARSLEAGDVKALAVLEGNPAYAAPSDLRFAERLAAADRTLYLGPYENETGARCAWYVPAAHYLETWADARALDGTRSIVQPAIRPIWGGRSPDALLRHLVGLPDTGELELLRAEHTEEGWRRTLRRGLVEDSAAETVAPAADGAAVDTLASRLRPPPRDRIEVAFRLDPRIHDGSFANNAWLQELPDPVTKLTWDNAALLAPAHAERLGLEQGDWVEITVGGEVIAIPVLPVPGHADRAVTLTLGYGRRSGERTASDVGVDVGRLRTTERPFLAAGNLRAMDREPHTLARTQMQFDDHGREQILHHTLEAWRADEGFTDEHAGPVETWYEPPRVQPARNQWGMTIDLSACTGCGACIQACQVENNVPVVGKDEVAKGRAMHWIRIDRYVSGSPEAPEVHVQPMLCQHCEKAPCEYVCPVNATVHSPDGLNEMIYNRCVGTRFCSNNCPYKVRRFNWFDYNERRPEAETLVLNPDVTVRERGVMEKCTYCVQRIRRAQIRARREGRPLDDGEVVTACQQACPTRVITFGDIADPDSRVSRTRTSTRIYQVLHELGTQPRTRYLAEIRNPNPGLELAWRALDGPGEDASDQDEEDA